MAKTRNQALTDRQMAFVDHYLITVSAHESALRAGYSKKTARVQGAQILKHPLVAAELQARMGVRAHQLSIRAEDVFREIARVAFSDIRHVAEFGAEGVELFDSKEIHPDAAPAIKEIQKRKSVTETSSEEVTVIKMHNKLGALALLGRHLGLW